MPSEIMLLTITSATLIAIVIQPVFGDLLLGFIKMEGRALPTDITTP